MLILIRHATSNINYNACNANEACKRISSYNTTSSLNFNEIDDKKNYLLNLVSDADKLRIYSSALPRAASTADHIFNRKYGSILQDPLFNEFDLQILRLPFIKLPTKGWLFISRLFWFFGMSRGARSFSIEKLRVKKAARKIEQSLNSGMCVVLVGHGLFNKFLERIFLKKGWSIKNSYKKGCFEYKQLQKD